MYDFLHLLSNFVNKRNMEFDGYCQIPSLLVKDCTKNASYVFFPITSPTLGFIILHFSI